MLQNQEKVNILISVNYRKKNDYACGILKTAVIIFIKDLMRCNSFNYTIKAMEVIKKVPSRSRNSMHGNNVVGTCATPFNSSTLCPVPELVEGMPVELAPAKQET